jgi:hypothetical protein
MLESRETAVCVRYLWLNRARQPSRITRFEGATRVNGVVFMFGLLNRLTATAPRPDCAPMAEIEKAVLRSR